MQDVPINASLQSNKKLADDLRLKQRRRACCPKAHDQHQLPLLHTTPKQAEL